MCTKPLEAGWVDLQVGWGGVSGNYQGRANGINQVDGGSDMAPICVCMPEEGGLNEGAKASASASVWEKAAPLAFALKPDNPVPSHMSPAPFKLLHQRWSSE